MTKKSSGINTDLGSTCSKTAYGWAKKTFANRKKNGKLVQTVDGSYASLMDFNGVKVGISSDGIGTKIEIAERMQRFDTLGYDLLAMTIDDLICNGFEPAFISNILDVDVLDHDTVDALMRGLYEAATFSNVVVTGGEIAELGARIGGYGKGMHFNWCATGIGKLHDSLSMPLNGNEIEAGDSIISLYSPGLRSNGFSLVRKILTEKYGERWHTRKMPKSSITWGEAVLTPCLIYTPLLVKLMDKKVPLHGAAHITGGGVVDNLGRLLKHKKFGAELTQLFSPDDSIRQLMQIGSVSARKAYNYWNMNNGMMLIVPKKSVKKTMHIIESTTPYRGLIAGTVTEEAVMKITLDNEILVYNKYDTK